MERISTRARVRLKGSLRISRYVVPVRIWKIDFWSCELERFREAHSRTSRAFAMHGE